MFKCCRKKPIGKESYEVPEIPMVKKNFTKMELDIMVMINRYRKSFNLSELEKSLELVNVARIHTAYMLVKGKASHTSFPKRNEMVLTHTDATWLGENVAFGYGTSWGVMTSWIDSEGHDKILRTPKAKKMAISVMQDANLRNYFTLLLSN